MASAAARTRGKHTDIGLCPFTVIIDTREQSPFSFSGIKERGSFLVVRTSIETLQTGDYSILGFKDQVSIERKSKEDLYQTLTHGRERFVREFERLTKLTFAAVIVEASLGSVSTDPPVFSGVRPKSIYRSVLAFQVRFPNVQWIFCDDRRFAEITTFRLLERFHQDHNVITTVTTAATKEPVT